MIRRSRRRKRRSKRRSRRRSRRRSGGGGRGGVGEGVEEEDEEMSVPGSPQYRPGLRLNVEPTSDGFPWPPGVGKDLNVFNSEEGLNYSLTSSSNSVIQFDESHLVRRKRPKIKNEEITDSGFEEKSFEVPVENKLFKKTSTLELMMWFANVRLVSPVIIARNLCQTSVDCTDELKCMKQCRYDGTRENHCSCDRNGVTVPQDTSRFECTLRLVNTSSTGETVRPLEQRVLKQITKYLKGANLMKYEDAKILNITLTAKAALLIAQSPRCWT
ncbi:unnamed protein product, partial [Nesidiocoris tenuis]